MRDLGLRRVTVDLEPEDHRALKQYALDNDTTITEVLRSALDEIRADESTRTRVTARIGARRDPGTGR